MNDIRQGAISIIYKESNRKLAQEVDSLKAQLAHQTILLREALEAIEWSTTYGGYAKLRTLAPKIREAIK